LVDRIKNLQPNALQNDKEEDILFKKFAATRIFNETKCAENKTHQSKCAAGQIFGLNSEGKCVLLLWYAIHFSSITAQNLLSLVD